MNYECLICQVKGLQKRMDKYEIAEEKRNTIVSQAISRIAGIDLDNSYSPEITRNILKELEKESEVKDPYAAEKKESNQALLSRYSEFKKKVEESDDKFDTALRYAIAGNIIDFGPTHRFDVDETIEQVFETQFAIDNSNALKTAIIKAKSILYLCDNSGEIVMDKLFLETIDHPNVTVAVRDQPILNDATLNEATEVGLHKVARLITNGDDAPSTLLHRVSKEFLEIYNSADLIISKGMGNFEGLMDENDPRLFYLLMIKCPVIGLKVGAEKGDFVVKRSKS
ncbi:ARMT1-like domain-containing protein [Draconibacterium sp. IB214405]|uniref:damage-control phosphatase ARMT1 family protein n=1 Tax=Draconibacterium sp. IB214405 TaxID=3097352 RepID=UPI002A0E4559|nr:ARMT1-like domain-containing protein [Draconibacterium sp. IB214405]MDX8338020.1 ARMT1-like domain-containing protein [Draconibacterium sp. IB214405]